MKKLLTLFMVAIAATNLFASNVITYTAIAKLKETTTSSYDGLHTNAFNVSISSHTFSNGTGTITFNGEVTKIGDDAFKLCQWMTSITIPNSVTTIGECAFDLCNTLTSITFGKSLTTIGESAFFGCHGLTSVTIPNSVTTIGNKAFYLCSGLTSVTIPNSVKTIGSSAFGYVNNIVYNGTATGSPWGAKCVNGYVDGYFVYSDATKTALVSCSTAATGAITIPNSVTTIEDRAFENCNMTSVTIPNSVTTIGDEAFYDCSGLTSVSIGNSVKTIGDKAFTSCSSLTSIDIPNSVTTIGGSAFKSCTELTSVTIGNSVTTIGNFAFSGCSGLTSVTIPNSVTTIGGYAFEGCYSLTSVTIPNSVTTIGRCAFEGCSGLTSITIPNSVTKIGLGAFTSCRGLKKTNYTGTIADWCKIKFDFYEANPMYYSHNFYINDVEVKDLVIPEGVDTIRSYAFSYCSSLTSVTIPNSVIKIGNYVFGGCSGLASITCYATNPPTCGIDITSFEVATSIPVYVPAQSVDAYKQAEEWKNFTNIQPIGAINVPTISDVVVAPEANQVTFTWPAEDQAAGYSIEITKDGVVFCTLKFNAQGQLTGIAFAPSRGAAREMASAEMTANGWQFTVTGLNQASKYGYTLDALNASQQSIKHYQGEFATDGYTGINRLTVDNAQCTVKKIIKDNHLYILNGKQVFDAAGRKVK